MLISVCVCVIQTISELAIMMEMKKAKVAETVKEHRADELSAMFNLIMDQKRFQRGMFLFVRCVGRGLASTQTICSTCS